MQQSEYTSQHYNSKMPTSKMTRDQITANDGNNKSV